MSLSERAHLGDPLKLRAAFVADAMAARAEAVSSGEGFHASDVHAYVRARVRGNAAPTPKAKSWRDCSALCRRGVDKKGS
jgi:hypothetical protein